MEERHTEGDNSHNDDCRDDVSDNDDNCIVFLPGESDSNGNHNIESGSEDDEYCYLNKRPCVKQGKYLKLFVIMI
jgi:hypothetical protein